MRELSLRVALCLLGLLAPGVSASADTRAQALAETMDMLRHAIAVETVEGKGQMPTFATYLAGKLESAGFAKSDMIRTSECSEDDESNTGLIESASF